MRALQPDEPDIDLQGGPDVFLLQQRVAELEIECAEYRALDETAGAIPFRLQPDLQRFTYIGPQAERLLGIAQAKWVESGFFEAHLSPEDRVAIIEQCRLVVESAGEHEAEFRFRRDDGSWVWLRCAMRLFESSRGPTLAGHFVDVTVRRMLATAHAESQKLDAIGCLASGLAHEINTPIQYMSDSITFVQDGIRELQNVLGEYRLAASSLADAEVERLAELERSNRLPFLAEHLPLALVRTLDGLARIASLVQSMKELAHPDRQVGRGSGQGLAVARATIENHGGALTFESVPRTGTTFLVRLPIAGTS